MLYSPTVGAQLTWSLTGSNRTNCKSPLDPLDHKYLFRKLINPIVIVFFRQKNQSSHFCCWPALCEADRERSNVSRQRAKRYLGIRGSSNKCRVKLNCVFNVIQCRRVWGQIECQTAKDPLALQLEKGIFEKEKSIMSRDILWERKNRFWVANCEIF